MKLLLQTSLEVKKHCESLNNKGKQELYRQVMEEAKVAIESNDIDQLKKLSEAAVAMEEVSEKELLESFDDENPLKEANIVVERDGLTNYLFSLGDSSKLYDLRENKEEALYQAIKSDDVELVKHVLIVLLSSDFEGKVDLKGLVKLLSKGYEELNLSKDMKNYLERKIGFCRFLCDFKFDEDPIELFANRSEVDYEIDKFLLSLITKKTKEEELLSEISSMIELLKKYEKFDGLEYKIRRLKSELESGKSKYSTEVIRDSIKEREKEMEKIKEKYIKSVDLIDERKRLVKQLLRTVAQ
ncbi:hypothetical protein [Wolbachia endosymbiont of Folsomia candida]|uniref:hypothetical protein n=1 Tax=Wolbachia endosymbiont of Folsomia candida TaxID=169402 RepID=UPI000B22EC90|nr:hypothetical protein [Wolbachia endosymbiont of Folsomia candida]APR97840.1 hypothetical protein ASM33_00635 [Wolbachia endosymbiont of Folsomia candida]